MGKYTKALKIRLKARNTATEIAEAITTPSQGKLIFICPRNFPILAEIAVLKKIKATAQKAEKEILFIAMQKWIRDMLLGQNIPVEAKCPKQYLDTETVSIDDLVKKESTPAKKNKTTFTLTPPTPEPETNKVVAKETPPKPTKKATPPPQFSTQKIEPRSGQSIRGIFFFLLLGFILLLGAILLWISPKATISIKPKISVIPVTQNIIVRLPGADIPQDERIVPAVEGIFVETEISGSETFPSTDKKYDLTNATGKVTLYNETNRPKYLVPSRLSTDEGVIVRFGKNITVPPKTNQTPGTLVVEVKADEYDSDGQPIGARGNIAAGTDLFFPALRPDSRELYYARANQGPLVGGSTLTHYYVNRDDFGAAKTLLHDMFRTRAVERLQQEMEGRSAREGKKYVLLDRSELTRTELTDVFFPEHLVGSESQTFTASASLKLYGLVFDQTEVARLLTEKARAIQDHRKKLLHMDPQSAQYRVLNANDLENSKWVKLSVSMLGVETLDFNAPSPFAHEWREKLKKEIAGKGPLEAQRVLTNYPEIEDIVNMEIAPLWAENLPKLYDQIQLEVIEEYE